MSAGPASTIPHRIVPLALAAALLLLGVPQLAQSVMRLSAQSGPAAVTVYGEGELLSTIPGDPDALEQVDADFGDPEARIRAGIKRFYRAFPDTGGGPDAAELTHAIADLRAGLARAPANAVAWTILGRAALFAGDADQALRAFRASIRFARYEPGAAMMRLDLAFRLWSSLDEGDRLAVKQQVLSTWRDRPEQLVTYSRRAGFQQLVMALLADDQAQLVRFLDYFARLPD
ncbi:MAG: hypothetical protein ACM30I_07375 [Gemmatimonas sp.]